jgi:hypothetical protein
MLPGDLPQFHVVGACTVVVGVGVGMIPFLCTWVCKFSFFLLVLLLTFSVMRSVLCMSLHASGPSSSHFPYSPNFNVGQKVTKNPLLYKTTKHYMLATLHGPEPTAPFHKIYVPIGTSLSKSWVGTWNFINTTQNKTTQ